MISSLVIAHYEHHLILYPMFLCKILWYKVRL